jgi:hypothetical protein
MNKIIIISTYPSDIYELQILSETLKSFNNLGYKLMIVSHLPLPEYIQKQVDYFIYDAENIIIPSLSQFWFANQWFKITINNLGHMVAICKNITNGIKMAHNLGFDYFYYTEADNIISHLDNKNLDKFLNQMIDQEKKMIFHKFSVDDNIAYNTIFFGGNVKYFIDNIKLPITEDEYHNYNISGILEYDFYNHLNRNEDIFLIKKCNSNILEGYENSKINKISNIDIICEVLKSNNNDYILFLMNNTKEIISFTVDGDTINLDSNTF